MPIPPVVRGNRKQIPLKMAWTLTIHKSQGTTLDRATIDIETAEHQGMTFTTISRVKFSDELWICPPFSIQCYPKMKDCAFVTIINKEDERLKAISL